MHDSFTTWLKGAAPGEKVMYYIGLLMKDRVSLNPWNKLTYIFNETHFEALEVWRAYEKGLVSLLQRKRKDGEYEYWAVRRAKGTLGPSRRERDRTGVVGDYQQPQHVELALRPRSMAGPTYGRRAYVVYSERPASQG